ncbi:peptidyl-prolyl cis-trans isomerase [Tamlana haliotis]|uniref:Peptidyl-prolyl cis-trans isomerase n=1 Tax=Pseudotamlana haliotis TaxID=2614804 RepID=A0A6N6MB52_9FLAO|nr:peptidylprolyl isomerase [Tamlana haliotis]KAB1067790.1 peptidyl-prolyl cis-trans isomerase [Tamlana haliotis]
MTKFYKHPIVHIIVFGLLLATILILVFGAKLPSQDDKRIIIGDDDFAHILASWEKTWQRQPTKAEFRKVLKSYVRDQVIYHEAKSQKLDENNGTVKRALITQMNMLAETQGTSEGITEADLKAYYELRKDKYLKPAEIAFSQIYFKANSHSNKSIEKIKNLLNVKQTLPNHVSDVGDLTMLDSSYDNTPAEHIDNTLGENFSSKLLELPLKSWQGPIISAYGKHLVYVNQITPEAPKQLEAVKTELIRELKYEVKEASKDQFFTELMQQYEIIYTGELKKLVYEK